MSSLIDQIIHLDKTLGRVVEGPYGHLIYVMLFAIVFCETGLVVTPFLPGDSLLFAAGALAGAGTLDIAVLAVLFFSAAFCGDNANYLAGRLLGPRILKSDSSRFFNRKHLDRTHAFFERYGGKTIILARFVPIVRTFTPFVAGIGAMTYPRFLAYSIGATTLWVGVCVGAGYYFGRLPSVSRNFTLIILAVVFLSVLPAIVEIVRHRAGRSRRDGSGPA